MSKVSLSSFIMYLLDFLVIMQMVYKHTVPSDDTKMLILVVARIIFGLIINHLRFGSLKHGRMRTLSKFGFSLCIYDHNHQVESLSGSLNLFLHIICRCGDTHSTGIGRHINAEVVTYWRLLLCCKIVKLQAI